jgi:hypothetical protein
MAHVPKLWQAEVGDRLLIAAHSTQSRHWCVADLGRDRDVLLLALIRLLCDGRRYGRQRN